LAISAVAARNTDDTPGQDWCIDLVLWAIDPKTGQTLAMDDSVPSPTAIDKQDGPIAPASTATPRVSDAI